MNPLKNLRQSVIYKMTPEELFWYFVKERYNIYIKKEVDKLPPPWTNDPILREYRFTNVFREDDRVTRWVRENIRQPYMYDPNLWFYLALTRVLNWPPSIEALIKEMIIPIKRNWQAARAAHVLNGLQAEGNKIYTGAYMIRAESNPNTEWYNWTKQEYITKVVLGSLWKARHEFYGYFEGYEDFEDFKCEKSLEKIHELFVKYGYGIGPFIAYQIVVDLRHTKWLDTATDIWDWASYGPGSKRGLNRFFDRPVNAPLSAKQATEEIIEITDRQPRRSKMPDIEPSDIQNCLCEYDKYCRVLRGEGRPRAKYVLGRGY